MKCILVLSLVALCYAEVPLAATAPSVSFGEEGTITVTEADGKKVVISHSIGNAGRKNIDISVPDTLGTTRTIRVNQDYNIRTVNIDDPNSPWYGTKQPGSELYQGAIHSGDSPFWSRGVNGASLQEYRDFYGRQPENQLRPVQDAQQYIQQNWQPSYEPYQQQQLSQLAQPQQQWSPSQLLWNLPKQQLAQEQQNILWNQVQRPQQLGEPQQLTQPQQLQSQQALTQPREQLNFLLPERQLVQELPWNQAQKPQQYYGPQQQYYGPQQQYYGPQQQYYEPQQQYYGPQQQYYNSQQQYYGPQQQYYGSQQPNIESQRYQQENLVYPQLTQDQQLAQQQEFSFNRGQQVQSNVPVGNYWQRLWAPQLRQMQYPPNLPVV